MEDVSNLILEHLKYLRARIDQRTEDIGMLKLRVSSIDDKLGAMDRGIGGLHGDLALIHQRLDGMDQRLERIERRLELRETV